MTRPRIGITTSLEDGRQTLDLRYIRAVEAARGIPLIVPMLESAEAARAVRGAARRVDHQLADPASRAD